MPGSVISCTTEAPTEPHEQAEVVPAGQVQQMSTFLASDLCMVGGPSDRFDFDRRSWHLWNGKQD